MYEYDVTDRCSARWRKAKDLPTPFLALFKIAVLQLTTSCERWEQCSKKFNPWSLKSQSLLNHSWTNGLPKNITLWYTLALSRSIGAFPSHLLPSKTSEKTPRIAALPNLLVYLSKQNQNPILLFTFASDKNISCSVGKRTYWASNSHSVEPSPPGPHKGHLISCRERHTRRRLWLFGKRFFWGDSSFFVILSHPLIWGMVYGGFGHGLYVVWGYTFTSLLCGSDSFWKRTSFEQGIPWSGLARKDLFSTHTWWEMFPSSIALLYHSENQERTIWKKSHNRTCHSRPLVPCAVALLLGKNNKKIKHKAKHCGTNGSKSAPNSTFQSMASKSWKKGANDGLW